jgi:hypothetical protein
MPEGLMVDDELFYNINSRRLEERNLFMERAGLI